MKPMSLKWIKHEAVAPVGTFYIYNRPYGWVWEYWTGGEHATAEGTVHTEAEAKYAAQAHFNKLIEQCIGKETSKDIMEFITWVDRCLFPMDFEEDLIKHGVTPSLAIMLRQFLTAKNRTKKFSELYQEFISYNDVTTVLEAYLDRQRAVWDTLQK